MERGKCMEEKLPKDENGYRLIDSSVINFKAPKVTFIKNE